MLRGGRHYPVKIMRYYVLMRNILALGSAPLSGVTEDSIKRWSKKKRNRPFVSSPSPRHCFLNLRSKKNRNKFKTARKTDFSTSLNYTIHTCYLRGILHTYVWKKNLLNKYIVNTAADRHAMTGWPGKIKSIDPTSKKITQPLE